MKKKRKHDRSYGWLKFIILCLLLIAIPICYAKYEFNNRKTTYVYRWVLIPYTHKKLNGKIHLTQKEVNIDSLENVLMKTKYSRQEP